MTTWLLGKEEDLAIIKKRSVWTNNFLKKKETLIENMQLTKSKMKQNDGGFANKYTYCL